MNRGVAQEQVELIPPNGKESSRVKPHSQPSFFSSLLTIAGGQIGCTAVAGFGELCLARMLGPASRGLVSLCMMSIAFGALIGSLGSESTVEVWISRFKGRPSVWFPA